MSDLISRKEVLDEIRKIECEPGYQHVGEDWSVGLIIAENIVESAESIESMPSAEPERKWISVTERLPEEEKDVLVFGIEAISNEYVYGVKRLDVDTWRPRIAPSIRWIAWMPLPEPWEGE